MRKARGQMKTRKKKLPRSGSAEEKVRRRKKKVNEMSLTQQYIFPEGFFFFL